MFIVILFFFEFTGDHRDLPVLTHSFPTRRSSDLAALPAVPRRHRRAGVRQDRVRAARLGARALRRRVRLRRREGQRRARADDAGAGARRGCEIDGRSEEHTSELQSLMRISYAVFCLNKKTITKYMYRTHIT